ncbi:MAG: hypothetical protein O7A04_03835 [Acidobacteria bacterium]|nr:hypothetical protein [Acidobacteriota bacterium]
MPKAESNTPRAASWRTLTINVPVSPGGRRVLIELHGSKEAAEAALMVELSPWIANLESTAIRASLNARDKLKKAADERRDTAAKRRQDREDAAKAKRVARHVEALAKDGVVVEGHAETAEAKS